ncbi:hypothetical protein K9U39_18720 [Rhodoblastus acidophilus]|uniref:Uncharacterized protein n=1 Tax=Candidatus Rhodoblastus alkanivorans TaxID=2954117 RepID=A0ABS9Z351_9HYPH|nr:hypothetical protein [Candidatus Rhodoblastus alkanivorans]MCI4677532.1 hypothetical protein [Candidatus Rhodoblastus alkanivorans]MCI4681891.1 hypothetical protein [Candidatus Rhodoblastus alkanivorans]MDI4642941.1 hypothetical protein [Rhodoblastus acidophilus]
MPPTTSFRRGSDFRAYVRTSLAEQDKSRVVRAPKNPLRGVRIDTSLAALITQRAKDWMSVLRRKGAPTKDYGVERELAGSRPIPARRPGLDLRRRAIEEIGSLRSALALLAARLRPVPATAPSAERSAFGAPAEAQGALERAEAELRARRARARQPEFQAREPDFEARRREVKAVQARLDRGGPAEAPDVRDVAAPTESARVFRGSSQRPAASASPDESLEQAWAAELADEYRREFHPMAARKAARPPVDDKPSAADGAASAIFLAGKALWRVSLVLRPVFRFVLAHSAPILKIAAVGLAILAAAGFLAQWPRTTSDSGVQATVGAQTAPPRPSWAEISKPFEYYDLAAPLVADEKLVYEARRHSPGGGREDFLTFGDFAGKEPFVRLAVYRHGTERVAAPPFFVDMARRAAAVSISIDSADAPAARTTRFGDFETAAMAMRKGRQARDNCRGFRFNVAPPGLTIAGFACGAGDAPFSAGELACLVNRLDLVSAGDDKPLRDFFAVAEARGRPGCAEAGAARRRAR